MKLQPRILELLNKFMNIKKHMRDEKTGLYYHGYDESLVGLAVLLILNMFASSLPGLM